MLATRVPVAQGTERLPSKQAYEPISVNGVNNLDLLQWFVDDRIATKGLTCSGERWLRETLTKFLSWLQVSLSDVSVRLFRCAHRRWHHNGQGHVADYGQREEAESGCDEASANQYGVNIEIICHTPGNTEHFLVPAFSQSLFHGRTPFVSYDDCPIGRS